MRNLNKSNVLTSIEPINRTLNKKVEKIIVEIRVQNVPSSVVAKRFCSVIQGLSTRMDFNPFRSYIRPRPKV
jgi:hypothetical protein